MDTAVGQSHKSRTQRLLLQTRAQFSPSRSVAPKQLYVIYTALAGVAIFTAFAAHTAATNTVDTAKQRTQTASPQAAITTPAMPENTTPVPPTTAVSNPVTPRQTPPASDASSVSRTEVSVNGVSFDLPANGTITRSFQSDGTTTDVAITTSQTSDEQNTQASSVRLTVSAESSAASAGTHRDTTPNPLHNEPEGDISDTE